MLRVAPARGPGMEVDDGEVRRPDDLGELGHAELVRVPARREGHARGLHPLRSLLGHALLVDLLARRCRPGSGGAGSAARTACARCRRRPRCSSRRGRASSCFAFGKSTLSGFVTLTTRSPTSSSTKGEATARTLSARATLAAPFPDYRRSGSRCARFSSVSP